MVTEPLFYEDMTVGRSFRSGPAQLSLDRLVAFAREFDPQPQHLDATAAADSVFGTLVASGWHTASLSMRLQLEAGLNRIPGGAMGGKLDSLVWRKPVLPGDTLHVVVEVMARRETRTRPDRGVLTLRTTTYNQHDEVVLEMTSAVFVPKRPEA